MVLIIFIIQKSITINILIMLLFLLITIHKEEKNIDYTYNQFLLERLIYKYKFKKSKIIKDINNFYRNRFHIIKDNGTYYYEQDCLKKKFHNF